MVIDIVLMRRSSLGLGLARPGSAGPGYGRWDDDVRWAEWALRGSISPEKRASIKLEPTIPLEPQAQLANG